jgi:hypothetical protein
MRRCAFIEAALSSEHGGRRSGFVALERFRMVLSSVSAAERGVPSPRGDGVDPNRGLAALIVEAQANKKLQSRAAE